MQILKPASRLFVHVTASRRESQGLTWFSPYALFMVWQASICTQIAQNLQHQRR